VKPLIGLTAGATRASDGLEYARLRTTYIEAVERAGGAPVIVPPLADADTLGALLERLDGLLLPGGADIDPAEYGEPLAGSRDINAGLDRLELDAARWAIERDLPILGICRGQQLINVALGGSLVQHIDEHAPTGARDLLAHGLRVAPDSRLAEALGTVSTRVNSHHHQAIKALGRDLRAVAWAPDGTIEGVESEAHPWLLAVQFHPEDLVGHAASEHLLAAFVEACRARIGSHAAARW
jgi:gamma-glutamyl-gamma-aminobutyrate hydrolase PuuD